MDAITTIGVGLLGVILGSIGSIVGQYLQHNLAKKQQLDAVRRQIYAGWLDEVFDLEEKLRQAYSERVNRSYTESDRSLYRSSLSWRKFYETLEKVRMTAGTDTELGATEITALLHENPQWEGQIDMPYKDWQGDYWQARRSYINLTRLEFGEGIMISKTVSATGGRHLPDTRVRRVLATAPVKKRRNPLAKA